MSSYLRWIALQAIGRAQILEPLIVTGYEEGWDFQEEEEISMPLKGGEAAHEVRQLAPTAAHTEQHVERSVEHHHHQHSQSTEICEGDDIHVTLQAPGNPEVSVLHTSLESPSAKHTETVRELLREGGVVRETLRTEHFAVREHSLKTEHSREIVNETQRLLREVQRVTNIPGTRIERLKEVDRFERAVVAAESQVEIHIGRIEVRAAPAKSKQDKEVATAKPKGVVDLNEYLRERSSGAI